MPDREEVKQRLSRKTRRGDECFISSLMRCLTEYFVSILHLGSISLCTGGIFVLTYFYITFLGGNLLEAWNWREINSTVPVFLLWPDWERKKKEGFSFLSINESKAKQVEEILGRHCYILKQNNLFSSVTSGCPNTVSPH